MAAEERDPGGPDPGRGESPPGQPARPRLRRSPFGYRRSDVEEALDARDAELTVLRQDIAALWLAFAQHDRVLSRLAGEPAPAAGPAAERATGAAAAPAPAPLDSEAASIGAQLSELDQVLAAIETATKRLERAYGEQPGGAGPEPEGGRPAGDG